MKVHILGGPGSGKTYLANKLSKKNGIIAIALDDVFWDNGPGKVDVQRSETDREKLVKNILKKKSWIVEGVYGDWTIPFYNKADEVIILKPGLFIRQVRILKRSIKD